MDDFSALLLQDRDILCGFFIDFICSYFGSKKQPYVSILRYRTKSVDYNSNWDM